MYPEPLRKQFDPLAEKRLALIKRAQSELGVREKTDHNDGTRVEAYLKSVGLHQLSLFNGGIQSAEIWMVP
jgi:hypothetical protein